jgi:hypothetical protein
LKTKYLLIRKVEVEHLESKLYIGYIFFFNAEDHIIIVSEITISDKIYLCKYELLSMSLSFTISYSPAWFKNSSKFPFSTSLNKYSGNSATVSWKFDGKLLIYYILLLLLSYTAELEE